MLRIWWRKCGGDRMTSPNVGACRFWIGTTKKVHTILEHLWTSGAKNGDQETKDSVISITVGVNCDSFLIKMKTTFLLPWWQPPVCLCRPWCTCVCVSWSQMPVCWQSMVIPLLRAHQALSHDYSAKLRKQLRLRQFVAPVHEPCWRSNCDEMPERFMWKLSNSQKILCAKHECSPISCFNATLDASVVSLCTASKCLSLLPRHDGSIWNQGQQRTGLISNSLKTSSYSMSIAAGYGPKISATYQRPKLIKMFLEI